jgi:hypothetical protein
MKTAAPTKNEVMQQLLSDITHLAHKHEVQYWLDAPGTDAEKLLAILSLARNALALQRDEIPASEA